MMTEICKRETITEATTGGDVSALDRFITLNDSDLSVLSEEMGAVLWPSDPKLSIYLHVDGP